MRRGILIVVVAAFLGVALVQDRPQDGGTLEIRTEPSEALISISGPEGFVSMLDVSGGEVVSGLAAGRYLVVATAEGHAAAHATVELGEGAEETVTISLEPVAGSQQASQQQSGQEQQGQQQAQGQSVQQSQQDQQEGQQSQQQAQGQAGEQQAQGQSGQQQSQNQVAGGGQAAGQQGGQVYSQQCAQCHGQQGGGGTGPALAGNQNLQNAQMVVNQILQGGGGMPAFANQLSDQQIAAVATHEMNSWGNSFGQVSAEQVAQVRGGGQLQQQGQQSQQQSGQQGQQQAGQQQQGQPQGQQQGQQQAGQQGQQQGQQGVQVQQAGNDVRIEITIPANAVPLTFTVQVQQGQAGQAQQQMQQPGQQQQGQQQQGQQQQQPSQQQGQQGQQGQQQQGQQLGFTEAQAQAGSQQYLEHCAVCHGNDLLGRAAYPAVAGPNFLSDWQGRSAAELFNYVSTRMPQDRPGSLGHQTYTDLTAFLLQQNGMMAGQQELQPESTDLSSLTLPAPEGQVGGTQGQEGPPEGEQDQQGQQNQQGEEQDQ